jgi:serine/threonine protein kinase
VPDRYLGRQIGKYRVIRLLGAGAFAWVYEAVDRDLEIPVALKILRPEFAGQSDAEARFRREASTAARLRHPNIVTVRDVGQVDSASFVAMDLLPLSLARRLELLTRLPEPDVVRLGLDVAAALAVAHAGGVVHRDIKPDNILIGTQGEGRRCRLRARARARRRRRDPQRQSSCDGDAALLQSRAGAGDSSWTDAVTCTHWASPSFARRRGDCPTRATIGTQSPDCTSRRRFPTCSRWWQT